MSTSPSYRPGYFSSLAKSCYDADFYARIKHIPVLRSFIFLLFFAFLISLMAMITLLLFWSHFFPSQEQLLADFDTAVPSIEGQFDGRTLEIQPSEVILYVGLDSQGAVRLSDKRLSDAMIRLQFNDELSLTQSQQNPPEDLGFYAYQDGYFLVTGFQNQSFLYSDYDIDQVIGFDTPRLRILLQSFYPIAEQWIRKTFLITGPLILFVYQVLGGIFLAVLFSFVGVVFFLLQRLRIQYGFLLQLSFYAMVPAFVVAFLTAILGISVPFLPILVYAVYYTIGLNLSVKA